MLEYLVDKVKFAELSEETQKLYTEVKDEPGSYQLEVAGFKSEDVSGLKANAQRIKDEKRELAEKLKEYDGIDVEEFTRLKDAEVKAQEKALKDSGDYSKLTEQLNKAHSEELTKSKLRIEKLEKDFQNQSINGSAISAISEADGNSKLLLPLVKNQLKMVESDGVSYVVVTDEVGEPRLAKDAKTATDYMPVGELLTEMKGNDDYAGAFKGSGASGGGSRNSQQFKGGGKIQVSRNDPLALGTHAAEIAAGKVELID